MSACSVSLAVSLEVGPTACPEPSPEIVAISFDTPSNAKDVKAPPEKTPRHDETDMLEL